MGLYVSLDPVVGREVDGVAEEVRGETRLTAELTTRSSSARSAAVDTRRRNRWPAGSTRLSFGSRTVGWSSAPPTSRAALGRSGSSTSTRGPPCRLPGSRSPRTRAPKSRLAPDRTRTRSSTQGRRAFAPRAHRLARGLALPPRALFARSWGEQSDGVSRSSRTIWMKSFGFSRWT